MNRMTYDIAFHPPHPPNPPHPVKRIFRGANMLHGTLTEKIIGCAMKVHRTLGPGFLESVYQNALLHELSVSGLVAEQGKRIQVFYDEVLVGDFIADILVEGRILIENKAVRALAAAHEVQLVNYLTA